MFQKWLDRKKGDVNRYRGGFAINDNLVLEGGTALHWAAYYGKRTIMDALIKEEAGLIVKCDCMYSPAVLTVWCTLHHTTNQAVKIVFVHGFCIGRKV